MLSFAGSLSSDSEALAIFVNEKYGYKDKKNILPKNISQKIDSYLADLKRKKDKENIHSFEISDKKTSFIIRVQNKYESYYPQEKGGYFFTYLKHIKKINKIDIYLDSLDFDSIKLVSFFSQFIFGFNLKSYTFNKYKTLNKEKINKKINFKIISYHKKKIQKEYK